MRDIRARVQAIRARDEAWARLAEVADRDPYAQSQEYAEANEALDQAQSRVPWMMARG